MWYLMRLKLGHKVAANGTPSQLAIQHNQGPDSVIPAQIAEMPFEVEFGEVKENDGGDGIDHSQRPPIPSSTSPKVDTLHPNDPDIESLPRDSRTRHRPKLPTGFEYTAWLTTAFFIRIRS